VTGPSRTAQHVAAHRLTAPRPSTPLGHPDADDALARDVAGGIEVREERMHRYLHARTAFFDEVVLGAVGDGLDQVVLLGAGYDGRALRFFDGSTRWFEVDLEATQADKRARLDRLGIDDRSVTYVVADFARDDVGGALVARGLDASRPTLFVLEGVASYLADAVLASLLRSARAVAAPRSRLAVSLSVARVDRDEARVARFREAVAKMGEPIRSTLGVDEVDPLLQSAGWRRRTAAEPRAEDPSEGERRYGLVLCEVAG